MSTQGRDEFRYVRSTSSRSNTVRQWCATTFAHGSHRRRRRSKKPSPYLVVPPSFELDRVKNVLFVASSVPSRVAFSETRSAPRRHWRRCRHDRSSGLDAPPRQRALQHRRDRSGLVRHCARGRAGSRPRGHAGPGVAGRPHQPPRGSTSDMTIELDATSMFVGRRGYLFRPFLGRSGKIKRSRVFIKSHSQLRNSSHTPRQFPFRCPTRTRRTAYCK
jgi:hypothetical protein